MPVENELINPIEVVRPHSARIKLTPWGQGLLIDNVLLLSVNRDRSTPPRSQLKVITYRRIPVMSEDDLSQGDYSWQETIRRSQTEASLDHKRQFGIIVLRLRPGMLPRYVGEGYKLCYLGQEGSEERFRLYSTIPMQAVQISYDDYRQILEQAQR